MFTNLKIAVKAVCYVKNWPSVVLNSVILRKDSVAHFRSGLLMDINTGTFEMFSHNLDFFRYFPGGKIEGTRATIDYKGKNLVFDYGNLEPIVLGEVFGWGSYDPFLKGVDLSNRVVVDIGASLGDTTLYFAALGAKKVVAIEPVWSAFKLVEENVKVNDFSHICDVIHAGVGRASLADIALDPMFKIIFGGYKPIKTEFDSVSHPPVITLKSLVEKYGITNGILKVDCEGWEYDILGNAGDEILRKFEILIVEYHYGFENLGKRLVAAGFEVIHTKPRHIHVPERQGEYMDMQVGMLFAKRK